MSRQTLRDRYGPWALVTGAARGLGAEFARQLAAERLSVVLVDADPAGLGDTARELVDRHGVAVQQHVLDLADANALQELVRDLAPIEIGLVVSNAAESAVGRFLELSLAAQLRTIAVNCSAPLVLAHELARRMVARRRGALVLVSSLSGFQGAPLVATYAATKAFNLVLAESLWAELRPSGIDVLAVAPGPIWTPGYRSSAPKQSLMGSVLTAEPCDVVAETLSRLDHGPTLIAGRLNRATQRLQSLLGSRRLSTALFGAGIRRLYPDR